MKEKTKRNYREAKALVSNGLSIAEACRRAGMIKNTFYALRLKERAAASQVTQPTAPEVYAGIVELPLEEQVIASDLSAKAKVKILSTLLNS